MIHVGRRRFIAAVICESFRILKMSRNGYFMYIFVSPLNLDSTEISHICELLNLSQQTFVI